MPASVQFDITQKCIAFVSEVIKDMPGNPGQEVLVERLIKDADGRVIVTVTLIDIDIVDGTVPVLEFNIEVSGKVFWRSDHPEAIEIIIETAEENTSLIMEQATIPGPWELMDALKSKNWKIVGFDI